MRISDWSSDVCSSDLDADRRDRDAEDRIAPVEPDQEQRDRGSARHPLGVQLGAVARDAARLVRSGRGVRGVRGPGAACRHGAKLALFRGRSEEHTSELQSLMRTSYAVFCLNTKKQ